MMGEEHGRPVMATILSFVMNFTLFSFLGHVSDLVVGLSAPDAKGKGKT